MTTPPDEREEGGDGGRGFHWTCPGLGLGTGADEEEEEEGEESEGFFSNAAIRSRRDLGLGGGESCVDILIVVFFN